MQFLTKDALSESLVPVLIGCSGKSLQSAISFHRQYGVLSHLFSHRIPFFYHLVPLFRFHRVRATRDETLLLGALLDFAKQLENADRLLFLVPCTAFYRKFVFAHKTELEGTFVLCDPDALAQPLQQEGAK